MRLATKILLPYFRFNFKHGTFGLQSLVIQPALPTSLSSTLGFTFSSWLDWTTAAGEGFMAVSLSNTADTFSWKPSSTNLNLPINLSIPHLSSPKEVQECNHATKTHILCFAKHPALTNVEKYWELLSKHLGFQHQQLYGSLLEGAA